MTRSALLRVTSPALVTRYNEALEALGLELTTLGNFQVDALGFSPELATERGADYLGHGPANPLGVIVSPNQARIPVRAPVATFYRDLMGAFYDTFRAEVADITRDAALWLDFDQGLSRYGGPQDLLLLRNVTVNSGAGPLGAAAAEQADLVRTFLAEPLAPFDPALRARLIASAHEHGDLRARRLVVPPWDYSAPASFYAPAFGGVFVLRAPSGNVYLVLEDPSAFETLPNRGSAFYLHDPELLEQLVAENLVALDMAYYTAQPEGLDRLYNDLMADLFFAQEPDLDFARLTPPQRRRRLHALGDGVPSALLELETLIGKLESGVLVNAGGLSPDLTRLLLRPRDGVGGDTRDLVWTLLARLEPRDPIRLYRYAPDLFAARYPPDSAARRWALARAGNIPFA